jgi:O-antigen/teichoic acid export membrane protein
MSISNQDIHEQSWFKSILIHGKWYLLSSFFSKGISLILLPVYTRYLTPTDYGILNSLGAVSALLPIFISLYLDAAFGRFFHDKKKDHQALQELFSTIYWFVAIFGFLVVFFTILSSNWWLGSFLKVPVWPYAFLAFIPPLFLQLGSLGIVFLNQSLLAKQTTIIQISSTMVTVVITLPLLIVLKLGLMARLIGGFSASLFLFSFYTIYFYKKDLLKLKFSKSLIMACLTYSIPLIPNIAGSWVAKLSNRLVIAKYVNLRAVGIYSLAANVSLLMYVMQDAITQVQGPISMSGLVHDKVKTKVKIAKFSLFLWGFMLLAHLGLYLFSKEILYFMADKEYFEAYKIIPYIGFTYVLLSQYRLFTTVISYHKKMWIVSTAGILMAFLNLGLNLVFVPIYGYKAAAITTVISMSAYSFWIFFWSQKLDRINLYYRRMFAILFIYSSSIFLIQYFIMNKNITLIYFSFKVIIYSTVTILFYYLIIKVYKRG